MNNATKRAAALLLSGGVCLPLALPLHARGLIEHTVRHENEPAPNDVDPFATESQETDEPDAAMRHSAPVEAIDGASLENESEEMAFETESDEGYSIEPRKVLGEDERVPVNRTDVAPYNGIMRLTIIFASGDVYAGTGFFVSEDTILTAGHCVYDHEKKLGWAKSIIAVPAGANPNDESVQYTSKVLMAPRSWVSNASGDTDYDLGLIRLREPIRSDASVLRLNTLDQASLDKTYELAGFPYNSRLPLESQPMLSAKGKAKALMGKRTLLHEIDSSSGQSGAPIINEDGEVEAIHTFAKTKEDLNGATAIDSYVSSFIATNTKVDAPVYRAYNPNSGEHFYTMSYNELVNLVGLGWKDEGVSWRSQEGGKPVYRLYNPNAGDHHYTLDVKERDELARVGWQKEGISWYGATDETPIHTVYRLYNPNAVAGAHHFTFNKVERDGLVQVGWKDEGVAFNSR